MEESTPQPPPPAGRKKIRLTKSEAYAMGISSPKKKRIAFGLVGLLILVALGNVLWHFQEAWLPYWLPSDMETEAPFAVPPAPAAGHLPAPASSATSAAQPGTAVSAPATLDFLSAAAWDHPQFLQGVRLFNQALDRYRAFPRDRGTPELSKQIEEGALQAAVAFDQIRAEAPADVPLAEYVARCQKLAVEARNLGRPAASAPAPAAAVAPPPPPRPTAPPPKPGEAWQDPDYLQGAKLFNQALDQYKLFQADKSHAELLKPIEDVAFQAAKKFEALQGLAPASVPLDDHISKCYRLIADCRRQNLEAGAAESGDESHPGKIVGPNRRPVLPAYQPPPAP